MCVLKVINWCCFLGDLNVWYDSVKYDIEKGWKEED